MKASFDRRGRRRLVPLACCLAVTAAVTAAVPALAHYQPIERHYGWGDIDSPHAHIHVCDTKADGYYVKVQYTEGGVVKQITDQDGSGGFCPYGHADLGSPSSGQLRLCKVTVGCSEWYNY
jgi:hypothetical protein